MKKKLLLLISLVLITASVFGQGTKEQEMPTYTASTAWTAGFAQLGGLDNIKNIAPADLNHPPEYEILPQDINNIMNSKLFIYAGYEGMMKTLSKSLISEDKLIKINTENSVENIKAVAKQISEIAGTEDISNQRVAEYEKMIVEARAMVKERGLDELDCLVNFHQKPLAEDLGLNVAGVFGPGAITPQDIKGANENHYDLIIDNVHTILSGPLAEVSPESTVVIWRNFPDNIEDNSLYNMVKDNISLLMDATE
ncbi:MAG: ABC transporter substrate-binding protein [Sphaerochaetaceae bacterium]|nr:ABC transporter substrate-binding protein [Sphaerochaetaceae bacterium]